MGVRRRLLRWLVLPGTALFVLVLLLDATIFRGSGFPPPHLNVPGLFPSSAILPGTAALVVNGAISPEKNHPRYWNNTSLAYATCRSRGFERVAVLQSDGLDPFPDRQARSFMGLVGTGELLDSPTDLDGDGEPDVTGPATRDAFRAALAVLGRTLPVDGRLFIFLTDHGQLRLEGTSLRAALMLWGGEVLGSEFDAWLREALPQTVYVTVLAAQCHGGIFLGQVTRPNTLLMSAGWPLWIWSDQDYSVFPYHFFGALLGRDVATGSPLREGPAPNLRTAFTAACGRDHAPEWPVMWTTPGSGEPPSPY